jgi:hypothetical protein
MKKKGDLPRKAALPSYVCASGANRVLIYTRPSKTRINTITRIVPSPPAG